MSTVENAVFAISADVVHRFPFSGFCAEPDVFEVGAIDQGLDGLLFRLAIPAFMHR
jgi:hypothetical protein